MKKTQHQRVTKLNRVNNSVNSLFKLWITRSCSQLLNTTHNVINQYPTDTNPVFIHFYLAGTMAQLLGLPSIPNLEKPEHLNDNVWLGLLAAYATGHKRMAEYDLSETKFWIKTEIVGQAMSFYWECVNSKKLKFPQKYDMQSYHPFTDPLL